MDGKIRVVLADDHTLVRQGIRQFLESDASIEVVGEAAGGEEAIAQVERHRPDMILLDIQMPGMTGVEATREISARFPEVKVLILTAHDDDAYVFALLRAGASGYLLKTADIDDVLRAVRAVRRGETVLSPEVTDKVLRQLRTGRPEAAQAQIEPLSNRELEILRLAAQGMTNKTIGATLALSDRTIQGHLAHIYDKLGVAGRTEAVTEALKKGWIVLE